MRTNVLKINYSTGVASVCVNDRDSLYYCTGKVPKEQNKRIKFRRYNYE